MSRLLRPNRSHISRAPRHYKAALLPSSHRVRGQRLPPGRSSPRDELNALLSTATDRSEREIQAMVDVFCAENGATVEMLAILKELDGEHEDSQGGRAEAIETVAARLTSHLLGVLSGSNNHDSTALVSQQDRIVRDMALTSELEAAIIARKAESVLQLIGRKTISPKDMHVEIRIPDKSDAVRILEVLLQVDDATARREMLVDAFDSGGHDSYEGDDEQEGLWTTPMVLYQAIENRLGSANETEATILRKLKEDILRDHLS